MRAALDAVCWHCLQDSNFWAEWCPEIHRQLSRRACRVRVFSEMVRRNSPAFFALASQVAHRLPKKNAEMSEMSEIPRAVRLRRDRSIAVALAESAERLSRAKPRGLSYSSVASLRRINGTVRSCQA
jgi:hypothetical protein